MANEIKFNVGDRVKTNGVYSFDPTIGTIVKFGILPFTKTPVYSVKIKENSGIWSYYSRDLKLLKDDTL